MVEVPPPPQPFAPEEYVVPAGAEIYRVFSHTRHAAEFNAGVGSASRFAFFGEPTVPVLYGAASPEAAVSETLLHEVPATGGRIFFDDYSTKVLGLVRPRRDLRLASFMGTGLRRLGVEADQLTDTEASRYARTVRWAEAAHAAGFEGVAWMSRKCNSECAYVLFGDRVETQDLEVSDEFAMLFESGVGLDWLVDFCAPLHIDVMPPI